jgi:hypothetical protein
MRHAGWTMLLNPSVISPKTMVKMVHLCFDLLRCIFALQEFKFHAYAHFVSQDYPGTCQWSMLNVSNGMGRIFATL